MSCLVSGKITMAYITFWEEKGIRWIFNSDLTNDDLLKCNQELYEDTRFLNIDYEICDFTAVEKFSLESDVVRQVARMDVEQSKRNPNIKVAIISNELVIRGLTRMYQITGDASAWETQIFNNEEDARVWINA
jgi:hypothetical protein